MLCLGLACSGDEGKAAGVKLPAEMVFADVAVSAPIAFSLEVDRFVGPVETKCCLPFEVVAGDMDLDGDADVFINWHHLERSELYENRDGILTLLNPRLDDPSGLYDSPGVPEIYAREEELPAQIPLDVPGITLWHDYDRFAGFWNVYVVPPTDSSDTYILQIQGNVPIFGVRGLSEDELIWVDHRTLWVPSRMLTSPRHIRLHQRVIAHTLVVRAIPEGSSAMPTIFAGPTRVPFTDGQVALTKPDAHGVAWVDAWGGPEPDLYLTRGALRGELVPPRPPKHDPFYRFVGDAGGARYELAEAGVIPDGYGRGRQVAWVDSDLDGTNELYVANEATPNAFLFDRGDGTFADRAPELGLAFDGMTSFTWMDVDLDGFDDLVLAGVGGFWVARNRSGQGFDQVPGVDYGLVFPVALETVRWFNDIALHVLDVDDDGDLDLWLSGYPTGGEFEGAPLHALFAREGEGFRDATSELGLAALEGVRLIVPGDFDNDGFVDAAGVGHRLTLLHNRGGNGFDPIEPDNSWDLPDEVPANLADIDGDGRLDLLIVGWRRVALMNRTETANRHLVVSIDAPHRPPIGAVVRAYYNDGRVQAQRYGSANTSRYSQSLLPLHYGASDGVAITSVGVTWPGALTEVRVDVEPSQQTLRLVAP